MIRPSTNQEILSSALRNAGGGTTNVRNLKSREYIWLLVYITAKSGSPTLALTLQCSPVNPDVDATRWRTVSSMSLSNADIGTPPKIFSTTRAVDWSGWVRVIYTVAGASTPKLTFSLSVEAK